MSVLSDNASCVLGSTFGFGAVLTYHMIESKPSPEMQEALDELVGLGILTKEEGLPDMTRKAVRYRLSDESKANLDMAVFRRLVWERIANDDAPSIRVMVPIGSKG